MTKTAALLAVLVAATSLTACSKTADSAAPDATAAAEPIKARCNELPQWTTKDEKGQDIGIYVCFGEKSQLLYTVRLLAPAVDPAAAARAEAAALRAELEKLKASAPKPAPLKDVREGAKSTQPTTAISGLPTLSGTAKK